MGRRGTGRSLKTARAVLQVLRYLAERPEGVKVEQVATFLGKSAATATYLLNSLCQEGYARRDATDGRYHLLRGPSDPPLRYPAIAEPLPGTLRDAAGELFDRTGQRTYSAAPEDGAVVVHEARGRQGLPRIPNLTPVIRAEAHALAIGKAALAHAGCGALERYLDTFGLPAYTPATITDRAVLERELAQVRRDGVAVDREEYAEGFCCIAAPLRDTDGAVVGVLGLSVTSQRFLAEGRDLACALTAVAQAAPGRAVPRQAVSR